MRGHIRKRGKNSWAVVISLGRDPLTRKSRQKWYSHKTRREAEAHLAQIISAMHGGGWTAPAKIRLADFCEQWLRDYAAGAVGPVSLYNYRRIIRGHLVPRLGHVPLDRLSAQAVQGYLSGRLQEGMHPNSVHKDYRVLREILGHAVKWGLLARNPAAMADPPKLRRREVRVWDEEQVRLFLAEAKRSSRYHPLYLTAILTGMRQGELLGLRWGDVGLPLGVASVRQTFYRLAGSRCEYCKKRKVHTEEAFDAYHCRCIKGQMIFKEPKTAAARRAIALPATVVEALRAVRADQEENRRLLGADYSDHGLVFCQPDGKPLHAHNIVRRDFREVMKQAGVPRITFHDLRHAHASYLALAGVPPKVAQERLGHATPHFTMQVYTHTLAGQQEGAAKAVEEFLLGKTITTETGNNRP